MFSQRIACMCIKWPWSVNPKLVDVLVSVSHLGAINDQKVDSFHEKKTTWQVTYGAPLFPPPMIIGAQFHTAVKTQKLAQHNKTTLIRIRLPAKLPYRLYNLWLVSCSFLLSRKIVSNKLCFNKHLYEIGHGRKNKTHISLSIMVPICYYVPLLVYCSNRIR